MGDWIESCPDDGPPISRISITPLFDGDGASSLSIQQALTQPRCIAHTAILLFETRYGNVPAHRFTEENICAFDDEGPLSLYFTKATPNATDQEWRVDRSTSGNVTLLFHVEPRHVDITTPMGPRVDMRRDQGGLIGNGRWFLPRPTGARLWRHVVEWDLSDAPIGTRALWSFGEGPRPIIRDGDPMTVADSVFMVGPIRSYPDPAPSHQRLSGANVNWFGELPSKIACLNEYNISFFLKLAAYFKKKEASYNIFIRRVIRGYGGGAYPESYVFEYDETIGNEPDDELISMFSHEMVHSFSMMDPEDNGYDNGWYIEGLAEFFSIFLPYRFGLRGVDYLVSRLNAILQAYGCSPRIHMDILDAQHIFYDDWYAELIPYTRGCVYLLQVDSRLRKASGIYGFDQMSPLDDIIIDMGQRRQRGEKFQARNWLDYLWPYLGDMSQDFRNMLRGIEINLKDVRVVYQNWNLTTSMQEVLEFGIDRSSTSKRIVSGLVPGSRAALAGLKNGDKILSTSRASFCAMNSSANMEICVERTCQKVQISYWPHSFSKACFSLLDIQTE
ncbi:hypothetical protein POX_b03276 [Penicillium oxalicum]|uniref:hypothetical protein n=1 Tax=Penicillium oxalicum TaxID=69781 RepID=UPI0020B83665|nr:hypothetical protein POX_b03276 [Penicillium oxalicum]KAI2793224.1 hypothetical protein POX_b03276 [Penicillium oxalicum]